MRIEAKLCFVDAPFAYFTTQDLSKQWGDGWGASPYEDNAGRPYEPCWHNHPDHIHKENRGYVAPGELCTGKCCQNDWNPDGSPKWEIVKVAFESGLREASDRFGGCGMSVREINSGAMPWLRSECLGTRVFAGITLGEFRRIIEAHGGKVYVQAEPQKTPNDAQSRERIIERFGVLGLHPSTGNNILHAAGRV